MRIHMSKKLLEDIINYLVSRPYNEVANLIRNIEYDAKAMPTNKCESIEKDIKKMGKEPKVVKEANTDEK